MGHHDDMAASDDDLFTVTVDFNDFGTLPWDFWQMGEHLQRYKLEFASSVYEYEKATQRPFPRWDSMDT